MKKPLLLYISVLLYLSILIIFFINKQENDNQTKENELTSESTNTLNTDEQFNNDITKITNEEDSSTTSAKLFADSALEDNEKLGIQQVSPSVGFETNLKNYQRLTWQTKNLYEKNLENSIYIDMQYPEFIGGQIVTKLNQHIHKLIQETVILNRERFTELGKDPMDSIVTLDVASTYRVVDLVNNVVSIEINITDFTGGGNGNHDEFVAINWDLESNKLLTDKQIFCTDNYLEKLIPIIRKHLINDFEEYFKQPLTPDQIDWINTGTNFLNDEQKLDTTTNEMVIDIAEQFRDLPGFLLKKDGIIVLFPHYSVTSGASGTVRTFIPITEISDIVCK